LPQKHLQPVLRIVGHCLVTGCNHIVVSILTTVLRKSTRKL
jgi:hypothetical protein